MNFHVLTLFPDMIEAGLHTSVTGRALKNGYIHLSAVNIRDYSKDKHKHVDDYPYGGGAGMVMQPEPIYLAYEDVTQNMEKKPRVVYVTPQGSVFNQSMAEEFSKEEDLMREFWKKSLQTMCLSVTMCLRGENFRQWL